MFMNNSVTSVELDPANNYSRILASADISLSHPDQHRLLQLDVVDTTNTQTTTLTLQGSPLVQVFFLKNRLSIYDSSIYSQVQSVVIQESFYSILGDYLKNYPPVIKKTPLISLQFFTQGFERTSKVYNIRNMSQVQLTELKIAREGYLYCMILPTNATMDPYIMGLHIKYGIDVNNKPATWKKSFLVEDPNWIIYFNIDDLPLGVNLTNYTFYYYATDKRVDELASVTAVNKLNFSIWRLETAKRSDLLMASLFFVLCALSLTF
jgi:hypothetical protein